MKQKFLRQCASCREYKSKEDLIRITKDYKSGEVLINNDNSVNGRSVYICKNSECIKTALKKKKIEHSLKAVIPDSIRENLSTVLPE